MRLKIVTPQKYKEKLLNCKHMFSENDTRSIDREAETVKGNYNRLNISCTVEETWKHVNRGLLYKHVTLFS